MRGAKLVITLLSLLSIGAAGCERAPETAGEPACKELRGTPPRKPVPVVILLNDAQRRDRAGVYGGRARTPAFDAFARANLIFRQAFTQAPWTRPSVATLFTGLLPSQHGVGMEERTDPPTARALASELTTLAELLQASGYQTAAFVSNPWMSWRFGFQQGFDAYYDSFIWDYPGEEISKTALEWLATEAAPDRPFFLYLHFIDSHRPYPPLPIAEIDANRERVAADPRRDLSEHAKEELRELVQVEGGDPAAAARVEPSVTLLEMAYERGIEEFDRALALFLDGLARNPAADRAVVIVTSDHGEAFYVRGYGNHGQGLYDDELAIPLAMRLPGISGPPDGVDCQVGLVDILPTLCSYLGIACPAQLAGRSLIDQGASDPRFLLAEAVGSQPRHRAIRGRRYKLIYEPGHPPGGARENPYLLYDVVADPEERTDLLASGDARSREIAERMRPILLAPAPPGPQLTLRLVPFDEDTAERLRELGYVQ
jgi:arylsulfatase A-like enzyme